MAARSKQRVHRGPMRADLPIQLPQLRGDDTGGVGRVRPAGARSRWPARARRSTARTCPPSRRRPFPSSPAARATPCKLRSRVDFGARAELPGVGPAPAIDLSGEVLRCGRTPLPRSRSPCCVPLQAMRRSWYSPRRAGPTGSRSSSRRSRGTRATRASTGGACCAQRAAAPRRICCCPSMRSTCGPRRDCAGAGRSRRRSTPLFLALMTDSDDTCGEARASYADFRLLSREAGVE